MYAFFCPILKIDTLHKPPPTAGGQQAVLLGRGLLCFYLGFLIPIFLTVVRVVLDAMRVRTSIGNAPPSSSLEVETWMGFCAIHPIRFDA